MKKRPASARVGSPKKVGQMTSTAFLKKLQSVTILDTPARNRLREKLGDEGLRKLELEVANLNASTGRK